MAEGVLCWVMLRSGQFWTWIDERDIDKHLLSIVILLGTFKVTSWAMGFAEMVKSQSGIEVAAIIAAVTAPYMALQAAAIHYYFKART